MMFRLLAVVLFLVANNSQVVPSPVSQSDENQIKRLFILYTDAMDMDWNAAGTVLITASPSTVRVWDAETLEQRYFVRHSQVLNGIQLNAAGDRFLTWSDSEIRLWETATGRLIGALPAPGNSRYEGVAWHGNHVLNWFGGVVGLWDGFSSQNTDQILVPGESFTPFHANVSWNQARTHFLTWNPTGTENTLVRLWAVEGELDSITQVMSLHHEDRWIDGATWSPDETMILSWSQNHVKVWDATTGDLLHDLNTDSYVTTARWSPNSRYVLVEDIRENAARIWDVRTGGEVLTTAGTDAMWDTSGERLLIGRQNIMLLDVATGDTLAEFGPRLGLGFAHWNPDGVRLLVRSAFGVEVWIIPSPDSCVVHALSPANLRAEPSQASDRVDVLPPRRLVSVTGQAVGADNFIWWQVGSGRWVRSDVVNATGNCPTAS